MDSAEESEEGLMSAIQSPKTWGQVHRQANGDRKGRDQDSCDPLVLLPEAPDSQTELFSDLVDRVLRPGTRTKTSTVWNFFHIDPQYACRATCNLCRKSVSRGKRVSQLGTSTLQRHLQARHPEEWAAGHRPGELVVMGEESEVPLSSFTSPEYDIVSHGLEAGAYKAKNSRRDRSQPVEVRRTEPMGMLHSAEELNHGSVLADTRTPDHMIASEGCDQRLAVKPTVQPPGKSKKVTSPAWTLFHIDPLCPSRATCVVCRRTVSRGRPGMQLGTSTLQRHLQAMHPTHWAAVSNVAWSFAQRLGEPKDFGTFNSPCVNPAEEMLIGLTGRAQGRGEEQRFSSEEEECKATLEKRSLTAAQERGLARNLNSKGDVTPINAAPITQVLRKKKRVVSPVWVFFTRDPQQLSHAICKLCDKSVSRGRPGTQLGTSTLQRHLLAKHPEPWELANRTHHDIRDLIGKPLSLLLSKAPTVSSARRTQSNRTKGHKRPSRLTNEPASHEKRTDPYVEKVTGPERMKRSRVLGARISSLAKSLVQSKRFWRGLESDTVATQAAPLTSFSAAENGGGASGQQGKVFRRRAKRVTSPVWKFFHTDPLCSSHAVCVVCNRSVSRGKPGTQLGTSTLQRHLLAKHPAHWDSTQGKE
ncbi:zinc finger BED domain-containing protein 4-like [Ascaphus truei]|uniref:zinc finger BED domain-containing protein 4-like n=1 Tax=Ascaphus truei TaxID=8439 RepID=UPI003F59ACC2